MRDSRERWTFIRHPSKPAISSQEVAYWKRQLRSILKVGMEFEFNLPQHSGTCHGDSNSCPCVKMNKEECWMECANKAVCDTDKAANKCQTYDPDICEPEDCAKCTEFKYTCHGIFCPSFVPKCYACAEYTTNCEPCPNRFDPEKNPDEIRNKIIRELSPNNCYGLINKSGVHSITQDGSLLGKKGAEVITIGRRIDFWEFYKMAKNILDSAVSKGAYVNERCSAHMHVLAAYYSKLFQNGDGMGVPHQISELEKPMPELILANFHQLVRRFQNALCWMSMGLEEPKRMTRWEKFRVSVLGISAVVNNMAYVRDEVSRNSGGNKYGFVNYKYCNFDEGGNITRLHVEMREMDGMLSPSVIAAMACLHYALMIKAVEISKYGILEVGDAEWMEKAARVKKTILNNMKGYQDGDRFGDTSELHKNFQYLVDESLELVRQLKHILIQVGPAYQILEALAEKPVALRRIEGHSWEKIEHDFAVPITEDDKFDLTLGEFVDLRLIDNCKTLDEWIRAVGEAIRASSGLELGPQEEVEIKIATFVDDKKSNGQLIWSDTLGAVVSL